MISKMRWSSCTTAATAERRRHSYATECGAWQKAAGVGAGGTGESVRREESYLKARELSDTYAERRFLALLFHEPLRNC